ncbi:MAG: signal recognition particle-docking protein FtsY [Actinomycetota bacterium]|nr:signal recognition particle-docking protein FtsY [Actinomycetota bacterium]
MSGVATWIWILIVVVVVLLALFVVGLVLANRRRISLTQAEQAKSVAGKDAAAKHTPAKGGYKAGGSISFSSGTGTALQDRPPTPEPEPVVAPDHVTPGVVTPDPSVVAPMPEQPATTEPEAAPDEPALDRSAVDEPTAEEVELGDAAPPTVAEERAPAPMAEEPAPSAPVGEAASSAPAEELAPTDTAESATADPAIATQEAEGGEDIAPTDGRLNRLRGRLSRSQNAFGRSMLGLLGAGTMDEDSWTDVEDTLLLADLGSQASGEIAEKLKAEVAANGIADSGQARALLRRVLVAAVDPTMDRSVRALPHDGRPSVLLVVGVNGTGKTTTTGKLARVLVADGRSVVLGAADTFRAAAAEQLATWAERAGATVVRADPGADPASVAFDAVKRGIADHCDAVLIDTAGRLHTKTGLMDELGKVKRVVEKLAAVDEVLLVLDATTGQNGLVQARVFADVVNITGIVLTKLDGTAKGGIVVAVQRALGVPVKLVGLGEGPDDLAPFEAGAFVDALLGD